MQSALGVLVLLLPLAAACGGAEAVPECPACPGCEAAPTPMPPPAAFDRAAPLEGRTGVPERDELYQLLMANADAPLAAGQHCESFAPADGVGPATFAYFYGVQLAALDEQPVSLETECVQESADGGPFLCEVNFLAGSDGESPWHCGLRFEMDATTRAPAPDTVMCIGTC